MCWACNIEKEEYSHILVCYSCNMNFSSESNSSYRIDSDGNIYCDDDCFELARLKYMGY
jgi:hypothetical protein